MSEPDEFDALFDEIMKISIRLLNESPIPVRAQTQGLEAKAELDELVEGEDEFRYILEKPGLAEEEVRVTAGNSEIRVETPSFSKTLRLDARVDPRTLRKEYRNGVLSVRVKKW